MCKDISGRARLSVEEICSHSRSGITVLAPFLGRFHTPHIGKTSGAATVRQNGIGPRDNGEKSLTGSEYSRSVKKAVHVLPRLARNASLRCGPFLLCLAPMGVPGIMQCLLRKIEPPVRRQLNLRHE